MKTQRSTGNSMRWMMALIIMFIFAFASTSVVAQGNDFYRSKEKHFKSKYKKQLRLAGRECAILNKKRNKMPRQPMFARLQSRPKPAKHKPMAEVDPPGYVRKYEVASTQDE